MYAPLMPIPFEPWIEYQSLTSDRLRNVATIIRDARDSAADLHDPASGDTTWSLGCRIYSRVTYNLRLASVGSAWLNILHEAQALRFTFLIAGIPMKFYRGKANEAPERTLIRSLEELKQQELAFGDKYERGEERILRFAVGIEAYQKTSSVHLVELNTDGDVIRYFDIPFESGNLVLMQPKPVDLPAPTFQPLVPEAVDAHDQTERDAPGATGTSS